MDNLKKWGKWFGIGIIVLGGAWLFLRRATTPPAVSEAPAGGGSISPMPIFMGGGGAGGVPSQAPAFTEDLGGAPWQPVQVPISENPDVRIAEINAGVQRSAIDAQKSVSMEGLKALTPTVHSSTPAPNDPVTKTSTRQAGNVSNEVGVKFFNDLAADGIDHADLVRVHDEANKRNITASRVVELWNRSKLGGSRPIDVNQVRDFEKQMGFSQTLL